MKKKFLFLLISFIFLVACTNMNINQNTRIKTNELKPDINSGIFVCQILINGNPAKEFNIYLSEVITDDSGKEIMTRFDRTSTLRSSPDKNGNFVILDVPPGRYGLIADYISHAISLENPNDKSTILISIEKNKLLDLGVLEFPNLD